MALRPSGTPLPRTTRLALLLTSSALLLAACGGSDSDSSSTKDTAASGGDKGRTITVGTSNDAPFSFHSGGSDTLKGIDGEMINAIAKDKGWKIKIFDTEFATLIPALEAKKIDVVVDAMYITDERKKQVDYAKTLKSKKLLVLDSQAALLQALKNKQADAAVTDSAVAGYAIAQDTSSGLRLILPDPPHFPGTIGAAVRKEDTSLLSDLNDGVAKLKKDGTDLEILKKFGLGENNRQP
jgi:polar amino acid transport system substrate-binding protein